MKFDDGRQIRRVAGTDIEIFAAGEGPPLLYLHADTGPTTPDERFLRALAKHYRVVAPWHPGFGRLERPGDFREVSDLAYLYLELIAAGFPAPPILAGASFGGWIAAEMAVRDPAACAALVLIAPLGIKVSGRETRDIADVFAITDEEFAALAYADPARGAFDLDALGDADLAAHFRARESFAYFGWKPFMHNPRLRRWLCRVKGPALVIAGEADRIVAAGYHAAYAEAFPAAELCRLADAGHYPHIEQPEAVAREIVAFDRRARAPAPRPRIVTAV